VWWAVNRDSVCAAFHIEPPQQQQQQQQQRPEVTADPQQQQQQQQRVQHSSNGGRSLVSLLNPHPLGHTAAAGTPQPPLSAAAVPRAGGTLSGAGGLAELRLKR
jgi:hypothetical protein